MSDDQQPPPPELVDGHGQPLGAQDADLTDAGDKNPTELIVDPNQIALPMGNPFALSGVDAQHNPILLEADNTGDVPGCFASLECDCGQAFKVNLLSDHRAPSACPKCSATYTHVLIVAGADDPEIFAHAFRQVLINNGYADDDDDPDDDNPDDQADDQVDDGAPQTIPDAVT